MPVLAGISLLVLLLIASQMAGSLDDMWSILSNPALVAGIAAIGILALFIVVLTILIFAFSFLGLKKFYDGRKEFGPAHHRNINLSLLFLLTAFVVSIIGGVLTGVYTTGLIYQIINNSTNIARAILLSLFLLYLVDTFGTPEKMRLRSGMALLILGPLISSIPALIGTSLFPAAIANTIGIIISMIGCLIFWRCYQSLYTKMESGEIRPIPPYPGIPSSVQLPYPTTMP